VRVCSGSVVMELSNCDIALAVHLHKKGADSILIQKILWYANCASLHFFDTPLVSFDFKAYKYGPFNRELRNYERCTINIPETSGSWNENFEIETGFLSLVVDAISEIEPNIMEKKFYLVDQTHLNKYLYLDLHKQDIDYNNAQIIPQSLIKEYFGIIEFENRLLCSIKEKLEEKERQRLQKQQEFTTKFLEFANGRKFW